MNTEEKIRSLKLLKLFRIDGRPADEVATDGQIEIFHAIISKRWDRVHIESSTQYGKSLFVAFGCIILSCIEGELVSVVAPTNEKAKIIMRYYIQHLGDAQLFYSQLEKESSIEKLQMETTKDRIILKNKGGIFILSIQAGNTEKGFEAAMGEGSKIVILDEAALVPDIHEATIFRMMAGKKDAIYIKIGNPFNRNHFFGSHNDSRYHKVFIDYHQGIKEGRYTESFIEEAKGKPLFSILYECLFPAENTTDSEGWTRLYPDSLISRCISQGVIVGERRLGCDIAEGGGDYNTEILRGINHAKVVDKFQSSDTMYTTGKIIVDGKSNEVYDQNWFIDSLGVGKGPYDRLVEQRYTPFPVKFSESAYDSQQFSNQRAECYWMSARWLNEGGTLEPHPDWEQLKWIFYSVDSRGKIVIMSKESMKKKGYHSPDVLDGFVSTFARKSVINQSREETKKERELVKQFDAKSRQSKVYFTGSPSIKNW